MNSASSVSSPIRNGSIRIEPAGRDRLRLHFLGNWRRNSARAGLRVIQREIEKHPSVHSLQFDTGHLAGWDSSLLILLRDLQKYCDQNRISCDPGGLPEGIRHLLALASAEPDPKGIRPKPPPASITERLAGWVIDFQRSVREMLAFVGEVSVAFMKMLFGRARFRRSDLLLIIQQSGIEALPIVALISVLVGLILAFVGAIQLRLFGAQIYVANLVGIAILRTMGAVMTGIIMAGRTGASFAARIGTMKVNEEIDALRTVGISPVEFLVLPRILALTLMMPPLTLYADLMGILGGMIVGVTMLDINAAAYFNQTKGAVTLMDLWIGLFMSLVFGILVGVSGCLRGIQCDRSASAVGDATMSAVVTGIVSVVIATAVITYLTNILNI